MQHLPIGILAHVPPYRHIGTRTFWLPPKRGVARPGHSVRGGFVKSKVADKWQLRPLVFCGLKTAAVALPSRAEFKVWHANLDVTTRYVIRFRTGS